MIYSVKIIMQMENGTDHGIARGVEIEYQKFLCKYELEPEIWIFSRVYTSFKKDTSSIVKIIVSSGCAKHSC